MRAVLLDVGGTLWPDRWPEPPNQATERLAALRRLEPAISARDAHAIVTELSAWRHPPTERQQTLDFVRDTLSRMALSEPTDPWNVIHAMSVPARGKIELFAHARRLLETLNNRSIRVVLATNVVWRSGEDQFRDLEDFGVASYVSSCVTSLDVGWRKPHPRFFAALQEAVAWPPTDCVMVGDSETNDIVPARELGMNTIRVAIEHALAGPTAASYVCTSLAGVIRRIIQLGDMT